MQLTNQVSLSAACSRLPRRSTTDTRAGTGIGVCTRSCSAKGRQCGPQLVRDLMKRAGLRGCQPKRWQPRSPDKAAAAKVPDLVRRDFTAATAGAKLVGDITYSAQSAIMCSPVAWMGRQPFPASSQRCEALVSCT